VEALLGELAKDHRETVIPELARALGEPPPVDPHPRPQPMPDPEQRRIRISVTALDRLRSDPYQFYASSILRLKQLDPLDADLSPARRGDLAHKILEIWHKTGRPMPEIAAEVLRQMGAHPLTLALWRPRLLKGLEWIEDHIAAEPGRVPA